MPGPSRPKGKRIGSCFLVDKIKNDLLVLLHFSRKGGLMAEKKSNRYWLGQVAEFLSPEILTQARRVSNGFVSTRRRVKVLRETDQERAQVLARELDQLIIHLSKARAAIIAGLPKEKWAGVGAPHEEAVGC